VPGQTPTTLILAHFDDIFAKGLRELIDSDPSLSVLASDVEQTRISVVLRAHTPDIAILDVRGLAKLSEIRELRVRHPKTRFVMLAHAPSGAESAALLAFGASACLARDTQSRDILNAIHLASRGLRVAPATQPSAHEGSGATGDLLTQREAEVLPLLQQRRSNAQIAALLQVGTETVRTHARNIYRKLGVSSRRELTPPSPPAAPVVSRPPESPRRRLAAQSRARRGHGQRT
jgi:two-component system, NarL family, nitrate/nitrite response regulator NarL